MDRRILAPALAAVCFSSFLLAAGPASAAQTGITGDPWVDQYIEQIPTASGGKPSSQVGRGPLTGLSRARVTRMASAGGDRFAAAVALSVVPVRTGEQSPSRGNPGQGSTASGGSSRQGDSGGSGANVKATGTAAALLEAFKGSNGGIGPVLPGILLLSLFGAIAFAAARSRRE